MTSPVPKPSPSIELANEYIALSKRHFNSSPPLSADERARWKELRALLDQQIHGDDRRVDLERRGSIRVPCMYTARYACGDMPLVTGAVTEIAHGGVFITTRYPYEVGTRVVLEIVRDAYSIELEIEGRVAWTRKEPSDADPAGMGVRFDHMSTAQYEAIAEFVEHSLLLTLSSLD